MFSGYLKIWFESKETHADLIRMRFLVLWELKIINPFS